MPTLGWRFFTINGPHLRSFPVKEPYGYLYSMPGVNRLPPYRWQPHENRPKCDKGCENPPTTGCGCGFYSVDDLEALCADMARSAPALLAAGLPLALNCVGRIELIGRITTGFKHPLIVGETVAERARIVGPLWTAPGIYYEAARTAERFYEVEVMGTPRDPGRSYDSEETRKARAFREYVQWCHGLPERAAAYLREAERPTEDAA